VKEGVQVGKEACVFSVFYVALFTTLPAMGDVVSLGDKGYSAELGRWLRSG